MIKSFSAASKRGLKMLRASQPFNGLATGGVRWLLATTGASSERAVMHLPRVGDVSAQLPNGRTLRLWSLGDDQISNKVFWRGWKGFDPESVEPFFELAERADTILDIGAYVGLYTLLGAHASPGATVVAFEPLPSVFQRLQRNVAANRLANVRCVNSAVGDREGEAQFYHARHALPTSSSLSEEFVRTQADFVHSVVPVVTIDGYVERHGIGRVDLVKIDTETTEPAVLRGMAGTLARDRPDILCEVLASQSTGEALEAVLRPLGYQFHLITASGLERRDRIVGHPEWFNYLFTARPLAGRLRGTPLR